MSGVSPKRYSGDQEEVESICKIDLCVLEIFLVVCSFEG